MEQTAAAQRRAVESGRTEPGIGPAIELAGLRREFGERPALDGIDLRLERGESLAVLGPNGSGKSTLLRILAGLLRPSGGEVSVLGSALPKETFRLRGRVGYLGHEPLLYRDLTPRKDLRVELRTLRSLPAMALFAVTAFVIFRFGLDRERLDGELAAGVLVPTLLFAALLAINRLFVAEREEGGFDLIRLAPVDRTVLFAAKASALVVYLVALELVAVPIFALFFLDTASGLLPLAAVLLLTNIGLAATGTVISTIATMSNARDLLAPLILLPLLVPLVIATAGAAEPLLEAGGPSYDRFGTWLAVLGLYDMTFLAVGYAVFDF